MICKTILTYRHSHTKSLDENAGSGALSVPKATTVFESALLVPLF